MSPSKVSTIDFGKFYNIIDGKQRSGDSFHQNINPATGQKNWDVPVATQKDVDDAVESAQKAFKTWSKTPLEKRRETLSKFSELYQQYEEEFTDLLCQESGKPRQFANLEVSLVKVWTDWHTQLEFPEEFTDLPDRTVKTTYKPLGVCGGICPWNFPILLAYGKIAPAVIAGCTIILKPSPFTPYTTLKLVELAQEVFPPGVVQVVGGDDKLGPMLTAHPGISKISFTGSIATGKKIMKACADSLKRCTLELGGNDASIVLPDVDVQKVAPQLALGAFQNSGQVCVATKRIYIHESIYKETVDAMVAFTKTIKVGSSNEEGVMLGPIQNAMQYEKVKDYFADTKSKGYKFAVGEPDVAPSKGYFVHPAIIDNPPNDSRIIQEEPFGPIVPCQPWSDLEEVIARANDTNTGLGACVWGGDVKKAEEVAQRLEAGSVFVNNFEQPTPAAIFGGHKESGIGGEWGKLGILSYCNPHAMHTFKEGSSH